MSNIEKLASILQQMANEETMPEDNFCLQYNKSLDEFPIQISINGHGKLNLPINANEAESLCKIAHPASFGWRDQTLLDKNIRNSSEIAANYVQVSFVDDGKEFSVIMDKIREGLGLPVECKLTAHLHNLLIYSPGQFFAPHQDTEKLESMVATLVVILPSPHLGGELIIDHHGDKKTFNCENISSREIKFIAFYADCYHEVKPVKEGYRIALTYNLVVEQITNEKEPLVDSSALKQALKEYFTSNQDEVANNWEPRKLVYLLDHSYTQHSLSWRLLKGSDRLRAYVLRALSEELGLNIYLVLAEVNETWSTFFDEDDYHGNRYKSQELEPEELINEEVTFFNWLDAEGKLIPFKRLYIGNKEICWTKASNEFEPFESEHEGWMGNYGNTIDYWYHRAAIIIWRKTDQLAMKFIMAPESLFEELDEITKQPDKQAELCEDIKSLVPYLQTHYKHKTPTFIKQLLNIACYIQDGVIANSMLNYKDMMLLSAESASVFVRLQKIYGKEWCLNLLKSWQGNTDKGKFYKDFINIIKALAEEIDQDVAKFLLDYQLQAIMEIDKIDIKESDIYLENKAKARVNSIMQFLHAAYILAHTDTYIATINYIINNPLLYNQLELVELLTDMEVILDKQKCGYELLKQHIINALQNEFIKGLRSKDDWSVSLKSNCMCEDCKILNSFLKSPNEQKRIWPMSDARRKHIAEKVRGMPLDVDIERKGSPYKLLLIKQNIIYDKAKERFDRVAATYNKFALVA